MKKLLKEYNKKRDFHITAEPSGETKKKSGKKTAATKTAKKKALIFVVQEHHASHLHYDFRIELDGVLKSWAVPKGPSMHPDDKRLAMEVEDHPLDYGGFEGTIPKGQYGGGEVYIWDTGTWEVIGDAHEGLRKGNLKFKLKGKKLKGEFVLVRLPPRGNTKNAWLLIKHHDELALEGTEDRAQELSAVAKKKVITKGRVHTSNREEEKKVTKKKAPAVKRKKAKDWPGFIKPQLALLVDAPPTKETYVHEIKFDGYRLQPHVDHTGIRVYTRNGNDWSDQFPTIVKAMEDLKVENAILDGEAVVLDKNGRSDFGLLQQALSDKDDSAIKLFIFDCLYLNGEDLRDLSLRERKDKLKSVLPKKHNVIFYSEDVSEDAEKFFHLSCKHGLEGIISKDETAPYRTGRSSIWCKSKCSLRQELVIGGYTTGKGNRSAELGALLLGVYEKDKGKDKFRYVGKVGTGFSRQTLKDIKKEVRKFEQNKSAFDIKSPKGKDIHWLKPQLIAEVSFSEWTSDQSLRHPVFIGLRGDKKGSEIVHEKPAHVEQSGPEEISKLSSPDKILFTKEKITKSMIADYYEKAAEHMIPYMGNRPLSLVRCPEGSTKQCFFQKHPGQWKLPKSLNSFKVKEKSETNLYISLNTPEGLRQLAQMNAFEIHTWNCHDDALMNPDQIVMDFDPDEKLSFKEVIKAAFELKEILDKLKLKSFVKLSGGKGLHVHIPFEPIYTWDQVKSFSKALADEMVSRNPDKYLANMSKKERKGKIFIDYLRNGYGATAVAPYSLRARATSAVAMPIEWDELKKIKSSDQFTLKKALLKLKSRKSDPWKKMNSTKQRIKILTTEKIAA
jgi:bifunctional non-homologous end joining protein LigD